MMICLLISPPFCIKSFFFSAYSNSHWAADEGWCHTYPFLIFLCLQHHYFCRFANHVGNCRLLLSNCAIQPISRSSAWFYWPIGRLPSTPLSFSICFHHKYCINGTGTVPQNILGTDRFPLIVMEMQTGSTINHISQIFFLLASPMYW